MTAETLNEVTQLDAMDDRLIRVERMVTELHAAFAPLLPMLSEMTSAMSGGMDTPMANPMLALLSSGMIK